MKTVIKQLQEALSILEDYPGIENILNLSEAKDLLGRMEGILDVPSMEEAQTKLTDYRTEMNQELKKWEELFDALPLVGNIINCVEQKVDLGEDVVLYIPFYSGLSSETTGVPDCSLSLYIGDEVMFDVDALGSSESELHSETYTWKEAYESLSLYAHRKIEIPNQ